MITVCMASYNGEKFVKRQVDSILSQLSGEDELVISDDGSTDGTIGIIEEIGDERIRLVHGGFKSPIFNFENAIKYAKGELLFLTDQDDVWLPGRIEKAVRMHRAGYNLVICNRVNVFKDRTEVYHVKNPIKGTWSTLKSSPFIGCMMSFDRKVVEIALPFPKTIAMHDLWIGLLTQRNLKCGYIDEPLVEYNRHEESYIAKHHFSLYGKLKYRWEMYWLVRDREKELGL